MINEREESIFESLDALLQAAASKPMPTKRERVICQRCNGLGNIALYAHVHNGKCYACNGRGYL